MVGIQFVPVDSWDLPPPPFSRKAETERYPVGPLIYERPSRRLSESLTNLQSKSVEARRNKDHSYYSLRTLSRSAIACPTPTVLRLPCNTTSAARHVGLGSYWWYRRVSPTSMHICGLDRLGLLLRLPVISVGDLHLPAVLTYESCSFAAQGRLRFWVTGCCSTALSRPVTDRSVETSHADRTRL